MSELIGAVITLAHSLGIRVVAEGVETRERRCDAMQSYYFSRPVAPEEISRLLQEEKRLEFVN